MLGRGEEGSPDDIVMQRDDAWCGGVGVAAAVRRAEEELRGDLLLPGWKPRGLPAAVVGRPRCPLGGTP